MGRALRLLLVEDSEDDALAVMRELEQNGYDLHCTRVETPETMSAALGAETWDVVIADYSLPRFSAPAALQLMQERGLDLPFVVVSGTVGEETAAAMMTAGAHDYLVKGRLARLGRAVDRELREAQERQRGRDLQKALLNAAQEWRTTFDAITHCVMVLDRDRVIRRCNRAMADYLDRPFSEIIGRPCYELVHGEDRPVTGCLVGQVEATLRRAVAESQIGDRWFRILADPVRDGNGRLVAAVHTMADITERKRAEEALRESEARYRHLFQALNDAAFLVDAATGMILETNPAGEALLGRSRDEIVGMHRTKLHPASQRDMHERAFRHVAEAGTVSEHDREVVRKDGTVVPVTIAGSALTIGGQRLMLGLFRDMTERKRAEEERRTLQQQLFESQKLESLGTLAGGVAHDFNNQLTVMVGLAEMALQEVEPGSKAEECIAAIPKQVRRGADLVAQLLAFGRRSVSQLKPLHLRPLVEETVRLLERALPESIAVRLIASDEVAVVNADATQVQQILMNLATNARDAMPDGGQLTVRLADATLDAEQCKQSADATPGQYVCLSVRDTGTGMTPETRERVFEPFFTTKGIGKGTGLGLAAVYGIVRSHGGHVHVYSEVGEGTEVKVYLPALEAEAPPPAEGAPESAPIGTETLLLIEDDPVVLTVGAAMLQSLGYTILTANNGAEGLEAYSSAGPGEIALVITDMMMPGMGGRKLSEALMGVDPNVRVLLVSGYSLAEEVAEAREQGVRGFVQKPFDLYELGRAVRAALDE
jgi:PAS domain S-box-containing protein